MIYNFKYCFLLLSLFFASFCCHALTIDTTITGNSTPGPYTFSWHFVDSSSISASYKDSAAGTIPPFIFIESANGLLFSQPIDSGREITIHYKTTFQGLQKSYFLYKKEIIDLRDSLKKLALSNYAPSQRLAEENLDISGFKSIGVSFGNQGQLNLEQALEVHIYGKIRENTILSANLSDQGTSLEGDTRELGEIDRVYISLENPRYYITAGDQYVSLPPSGIYRSSKKIKGISAAYTGTLFQAGAGGAISGGKYTVQTISGRLGFQGPYYLTGQGEADIIEPIRGTVSVTVDGKEVQEGENRAYVIDYDVGTLRFMPSSPINDGSIIQVHYEYKSFDYQRTFLAAHTGAKNPDSSITLSGAVWFETDNKNHPIDIILDKVILDSLAQAGDKTLMVPNGRQIHPNDVPAQDAINRLYKIAYLDSAHTRWYYTYTPFNTSTPLDNKGFLHVWFNQVGTGAGDYLQYDPALLASLPFAITSLWDTIKLNLALNKSDPRGPAYVYAGKGNGTYSAFSPVPAPRRMVTGEVIASLQPKKWLSVSTDIAGEEQDRNLFSKSDDEDNTSSAVQSSIHIGQNDFEKPCLWLAGAHTYSSRRFSRQIISPFELRTVWDYDSSSYEGNGVRLWNTGLGATIVPHFSLQTSYGQFVQNDIMNAHRIGYSSRINFVEPLDINYSGRLLQHRGSANRKIVRGDSVSAVVSLNHFTYALRFDDVWNSRTVSENYGNLGSGLSVLFKPLTISESVYYSQDRKGGTGIFLPLHPLSRDTGYSFIWSQGLNHSPVPGWALSGTSTYHRQKKINPRNNSRTKQSVLLVTVSNDVSSVKTGFSTHQDYRLSSEQASAITQVPVFVGKGQGTHVFDPVLNEFVVAKFGDYIIEEKEMFNANGTQSVRKSSMQGTWFFKPQSKRIKGILADLSFTGAFLVEEHIRLDSILVAQDNMPLSTWIPGYASLSGNNDTLVEYADIYYRQDINWRPSFTNNFLINLNVKPFLRQPRSYRETGVEWGSKIEKRWNSFQAGLEGKYYSVDRTLKRPPYTMVIKDYFLTLPQRYYFTSYFSAFANEIAGRTQKNDINGPYYRLQPGLTLQLAQKGWAELSYTWSRVDFDGIIEYPMAQGFGAGISHGIDFVADINAGEHFSITGNYRGEYNDRSTQKWLHVVSMEVKAFL